jgi:hypothetical protein
MTKWKCRDLGDCKEFLQICKEQSIYIDQCSYLEKVVEHFGMTNAKYSWTPLPTGYTAMMNQGEIDPKLHTQFQQIVGSLLYIMLGTRSNIAFAVTKLAQHAANPSKAHLDKAKYVLCYLTGEEAHGKMAM